MQMSDSEFYQYEHDVVEGRDGNMRTACGKWLSYGGVSFGQPQPDKPRCPICQQSGIR